MKVQSTCLDREGMAWSYRGADGHSRFLDFQDMTYKVGSHVSPIDPAAKGSVKERIVADVRSARDKWLAAQGLDYSVGLVVFREDGFNIGGPEEKSAEPTCQDEPIPGYVEETWVAKQPLDFAEIVPDWTEDLAGIQNAEARLRVAISRNERWPFCSTCQQNRRLAYDYEESETDHRLITKVTAFWTCAEEGEEDE